MIQRIGQVVGNYRITEEINSGTFGAVYKAEHTILTNRTVAIKFLKANYLHLQQEQDLFIQEAQFLEQLKHPFILPIDNVGILDDGCPYIIMKFASKGSLYDRLNDKAHPLPEKEILAILTQIGEALQYTHQQKIIHRDLKPANILFDEQGNAILADFGIAYMMATLQTHTAGGPGTPAYMAPEQSQKQASFKSDQYALGCIAYELFTGQRPFIADNPLAMMRQHSQEQPTPPSALKPNLSQQIEQAILKAMAKQTDDRYPDVSAFIQALSAPFLAPTSIPSDVSTPIQDNLSKDDIRRTLTKVYTRMRTLLANVVNALNERKIPPEDEFRQWKSIQSEAEMLQRPNVRNSMIRLLTNEPSWWEEEGREMIQKLCQLAGSYSDDDLARASARFTQTFRSNTLRSKGLSKGALTDSEDEPLMVATVFAGEATNAIHMAQKELTDALFSLVTDFADQVVQAIQVNDSSLTTFWNDIFIDSCFNSIKVDIWAYLLKRLSVMHYTSTYQQWWNGYGKTNIQKMSSLPDAQHSSELDQVYLSFIEHAAQELLEAIENERTEVSPFWQDVLKTAALFRNERHADVWLDLLVKLCQAVHIPAYWQWWQAQGKAAARSLCSFADKAPHSQIASELSDCAQHVIDELYERLIHHHPETDQVQRIHHLLELIWTMVPASNTLLWPNLVQKLSTAIQQRGNEAYSWELRALLLKTWGNTPILEKNDDILRSWLTIGWQELDALLALKLPIDWKKAGIAEVLIATRDYAQLDVMSMVTERHELFEAVLEQFMKAPATQQHAVRFFASLAQHDYRNRFPLLDTMLAACQYHTDVVEGLFASLQPEPRDVVYLLERYCQVLLSEHELTPALVNFIRQYLYNFNPDYLNRIRTRGLLQRLLKRPKNHALSLPPDLYKSVENWYRIAEFMQDPDIGRNRLRDLSNDIHSMTQLTSDARKKLADKLVPRLVQLASTEIDLMRVIDHLGTVLIGQAQGDRDLDLLLLEQMAIRAGDNYGQEHPPMRIASYIKVVFSESRFILPPSNKENFVDRCLSSLLKLVDRETCDMFSANRLLWPNEIMAEWQAYLSRSLNRFRHAVNKREIFGIINAYDPPLESHLEPQEILLLQLAYKFATAYQADNDAGLLDAYDAIHESPYSRMLIYTQTQYERLKQAERCMSVGFQGHPQPLLLPSVSQPAPENIAKVKWFDKIIAMLSNGE